MLIISVLTILGSGAGRAAELWPDWTAGRPLPALFCHTWNWIRDWRFQQAARRCPGDPPSCPVALPGESAQPLQEINGLQRSPLPSTVAPREFKFPSCSLISYSLVILSYDCDLTLTSRPSRIVKIKNEPDEMSQESGSAIFILPRPDFFGSPRRNLSPLWMNIAVTRSIIGHVIRSAFYPVVALCTQFNNLPDELR